MVLLSCLPHHENSPLATHTNEKAIRLQKERCKYDTGICKIVLINIQAARVSHTFLSFIPHRPSFHRPSFLLYTMVQLHTIHRKNLSLHATYTSSTCCRNQHPSKSSVTCLFILSMCPNQRNTL